MIYLEQWPSCFWRCVVLSRSSYSVFFLVQHVRPFEGLTKKWPQFAASISTFLCFKPFSLLYKKASHFLPSPHSNFSKRNKTGGSPYVSITWDVSCCSSSRSSSLWATGTSSRPRLPPWSSTSQVRRGGGGEDLSRSFRSFHEFSQALVMF